MRRTLTSIAALLALAFAVAAGLPAAAPATHEDDCIPYSRDDTPEDEFEFEQTIIALDGAAAQVDLAADVLEKGLPATAVPHTVTASAAALLEVTKYAVAGGLASVQRTNTVADECRIDAHWRLLDDILSSQIRKDLAVTTTPVAKFVLPAEYGGWIDTEGVGTRAVVKDAIDRLKAKGLCTCTQAQATYDQAVTAMNAGSYKQAYKLFRQAYAYAFSN